MEYRESRRRVRRIRMRDHWSLRMWILLLLAILELVFLMPKIIDHSHNHHRGGLIDRH